MRLERFRPVLLAGSCLLAFACSKADPRGGDPDKPEIPERVVSITSPAADVIVKEPVTYQVLVEGGLPDSVVLLLDGEPLASLVPPFSYEWDVKFISPGEHVFVARATVRDAVFVSPPRTLTVDCDCEAELAVSITIPSADLFVAREAAIQVLVEGGRPDRVELVRDGAVLLQMQAPYSFTWDVRTETEGPHSLVARAWIGGRSFESAPRRVVVDRTPPVWTGRVPASGFENAWVGDHLVMTFSEPLQPHTVHAGSVGFSVDGSPLDVGLELGPDGRTILAWFTGPVRSVPSTAVGRLSSSITDRAGNSLDPATWRFRLPDWQLVGDDAWIRSSRSNLAKPALAVRPDGRPLVARIGDPPKPLLTVGEWTGYAWADIRGRFEEPGSAGTLHASIAVDAGREPVVSAVEYDARFNRLYVKRWNGIAWDTLGGDLRVDEAAFPRTSSLAILPTGEPIVAWVEDGGTVCGLYVKSWTATSWAPLGGAICANSSAFVHSLSLTVDGEGRPLIAWSEQGPGSPRMTVRVRRWTGSSWDDVGMPVNRATIYGGFEPVVRVDATDAPVVAWWEEGSIESSLFAVRWDGSGWAELGATLAVRIESFDLARGRDGNPVIAWVAYEGAAQVARVRRWTGSHWADVGGPVAESGAFDLALAIGDRDDPIVAWRGYSDRTAAFEIAVHRFNGFESIGP